MNIEPKTLQGICCAIQESKGIICDVTRTLYIFLHSSLLFCLKLAIDLKHNGFLINPYEPCVSEKIFNKEMITVVCHVDDQKVSHKESFEVTKFDQYLSKLYGGNSWYTGEIYMTT